MNLKKFSIPFLLLALTYVVSGAQARDTGMIGGPGGGSFQDQCGRGQYLSGVSVRQGTLLDSVTPFCASYNAQTGLLGAPGAPQDRHGGSGGAAAGPIFCNNTQYVSGMMFGYTRDPSGRAKYITSVKLNCTSIRGGSGSNGPRIGPTGNAAYGGFSCGDGQAVIGMIGRTGIYVDALGLICGPRPVATGPVAAPTQPGPGPKPDAIINQRTTAAVERNVDRPGQDYRNFDLQPSIAGFAPCQSSCDADGRCRAWTYVNPGVQGPRARCWLKTSVPLATPNNCCTSGVKGAR